MALSRSPLVASHRPPLFLPTRRSPRRCSPRPRRCSTPLASARRHLPLSFCSFASALRHSSLATRHSPLATRLCFSSLLN
ncbi:uncharacterized protein DS421_16g530420 [Arachis hypogaea]|nr:uncharacterized protein DS421_16g530420 [Arachis hypogaea]